MKFRLSYILLLSAFLLAAFLRLPAQEFYNDGAQVHVQAAGLIYVQGSVTNDDQGANIGQIFNSGDIMLEGNWSNTSTSNVFQSGDPGTTTFIGTNAFQLIDGSNDTYFNNLTLAKPGAIREVRMNRDALCDGILALNDDFLNTQTNIFGVANVAPGAITRLGGNAPNYAPSTAQGFVTSTVGSAGRLSRTTAPGNTYLFPVGTLSSWRPVEITPTTGGVNVYSVQFVQSPPANMTLRAASLSTINPAWFHLIERQLPSGSPENIRIYHDFTPDNICDINNVSIAEWNNTLWDDLNPVVSMAPPGPFMSWTQKTGYPGAYPTPFVSNQFALAGRYLAPSISSCVFPVELLYLHAQPLESSILLNWETASESNNSGFEIQRSIDGLSFSAVGWVDGIGTSNSNTSYSFEDQDVAANQRYFYRLRQVDYDGGQSLSNIVEAILLSGIDYAMGGFFPNPSNGQTSLWLSLAEAGSFNLELYNALGQEVLRDFRELQAGYSVLNFNFSSLPKGAYFANLKVNGERLNKRLIIE